MTIVSESEPNRAARFKYGLIAAPQRISLALATYAVVAAVLVSLGALYVWLALPLGVLAVYVTWNYFTPRALTTRELRAVTVLLVATVAWLAVGFALHGEFLIVNRDPGFLGLSGVWLTDHPHTDIPVNGTVHASAAHANLLADAPQAWNLKGEFIQPQGAKMLPAVLAAGGWVAGVSGVLHMNIVIGAVGMLAIYTLARLMVGPYFSLVAALIGGLNVAHIGLSRATYTEPLTLLLLVTGIAVLWQALDKRHLPGFVFAAVLTGSSSFLRIDGALFAGAITSGLLVIYLIRNDTTIRRYIQIFTAIQLGVLLAGYAALWWWSRGYFERLWSEAALAMACAVAPAIALLVLRLFGRLRAAFAGKARAWANGIAATILALLVFMASRPLWQITRRGTDTSDDLFANQVTESFQRAQGMPIDPQRDYAESTISWLSYYVTWPVLAVAAIGIVASVFFTLKREQNHIVLTVSVLVPTFIYAFRPAVMPDQIWSIRRFESITLPGIAVFAALGAVLLARWLKTKRGWDLELSALVISAVMVLGVMSSYLSFKPGDENPLLPSSVLTAREQGGAHEMLTNVCAYIDGRPTVLYGTASTFGSVRVMCDVPVILALVSPTPEALQEIKDSYGQDLVVLTQHADELSWSSKGYEVIVDGRVTQAGYTLQGIPRIYNVVPYTWYLGTVNDDGLLESVN